jgi:hypothetical protein
VGDEHDRAALLAQGPDLLPQQSATQRVDVVGSSRMTTRPGQTVAIAKPTSRLTPPDNRVPTVSRHSPMSRASTSSAVRRRAAARPAPRMRPVSSIASLTRNESIGIWACGR